eukprot:1159316-Pelagomonas_calceolata.AAC.2
MAQMRRSEHEGAGCSSTFALLCACPCEQGSCCACVPLLRSTIETGPLNDHACMCNPMIRQHFQSTTYVDMLTQLSSKCQSLSLLHYLTVEGLTVDVSADRGGRRKRMQLAPKQIPTTSYGYGLTSVKYFSQAHMHVCPVRMYALEQYKVGNP